MVEADHELIETLLQHVLDPTIVRDAVEEAVRLIVGGRGTEDDARERLERTIAKVEQERQRFVSAIGAGGMLESLLVDRTH